MERDGFSLEAAVEEFRDFAAGGRPAEHDEASDVPVATGSDAAVARQNEESYQEVNAMMKGMSFR